jgi:predicted O-methyltransferase YrrM
MGLRTVQQNADVKEEELTSQLRLRNGTLEQLWLIKTYVVEDRLDDMPRPPSVVEEWRRVPEVNAVPQQEQQSETLEDLPIRIDQTGMEFTVSFSNAHYKKWNRALADQRDDFAQILEIGSFEGQSANIFLQILPKSVITCIDRFEVPERSARFDANTSCYGDRVRKISGNSSAKLPDLLFANEKFDVIYIDGSHTRANVYIDSLLCWEMLKPGSLVIWDDYRWRQDLPDHERVDPAVDRFLERHKQELRIIHHGFQVMARRIS